MFESDNNARGTRLAVWIVVIVLLLIHLILGGHIQIAGATPDFLFICTAIFAFAYGPRAGCIAGFVFGLIIDLTGTGPVGVSPLLGCIAGYLMGRFRRSGFDNGWRGPLVVFAITAFAYNVLYYVFLLLLNTGIMVSIDILWRLIAVEVFDIVIGGIVFLILSAVLPKHSPGSGSLHL